MNNQAQQIHSLNAEQKTKNAVLKQLAGLQNLDLKELRQRWEELYGTPPPQYKSQYLKRKLAFRIQELYFGGLSEKAKIHIKARAINDTSVKVNKITDKQKKSQTNLLPGTRLNREWQNTFHEVIVLKDGFEYNKQIFKSLSAIARNITGTQWNGRRFFGVDKNQ